MQECFNNSEVGCFLWIQKLFEICKRDKDKDPNGKKVIRSENYYRNASPTPTEKSYPPSFASLPSVSSSTFHRDDAVIFSHECVGRKLNFQEQTKYDDGNCFQAGSTASLKFISCIGQGSFGEIHLVSEHEEKQKIVYVLKSVPKRKVKTVTQFQRILCEKAILQTVSHPFIVRMHKCFESRFYFHFALEFCAGGDLFFHLKQIHQFSTTAVQFFAVELILALECLHSQGIIYRDLKPENVVLDNDGHIRLIDFGLAKCTMETGTTNTLCGSINYIAPEILCNKSYSFVVDFWSLGCVLYELKFGRPPFYCRSGEIDEISKRILSGDIEFPTSIAAETKSLLQDLLCVSPLVRLGSNGIKTVKEHAAFLNIDWNTVQEKKLQPPITPKISDVTDTTCFETCFTSLSPILIA